MVTLWNRYRDADLHVLLEVGGTIYMSESPSA